MSVSIRLVSEHGMRVDDEAGLAADVAAAERSFGVTDAPDCTPGEWLDLASVARSLSDELLGALRGLTAYAAAHGASNPAHPFHRAWVARMRAARSAIARAELVR